MIGQSVPRVLAAVALSLAPLVSACSDAPAPSGPLTSARLETTTLCPLVPARLPDPPGRNNAFGTDLGFTYERDGVTTIVFGDTWQDIDVCPIQRDDDSMATIAPVADDWPGFAARGRIPDAECPQLSFFLNDAGTAFSPIDLTRWDGLHVALGPLNTPVAAFHDGVREWAIFIVDGGLRCTQEAAQAGSPCPATLSAQAADLECGFVGGQPMCLDPTSTKRGDGRRSYDLHVAERVGPTAYVSRAIFHTNKFLNISARPVRAFDESSPRRRDDRPGTGALLLWGHPGFDEVNSDGEAPPYFAYHRLPLEVAGDRLAFAPRFLTGFAADGTPVFGDSQADAVPLYTGEFAPVNQAALHYLEPLERWIMLYGGASTDFVNPAGSSHDQPSPGGIHARFARDPWGPWTEPQPILTNDDVAADLVCGKQHPAGCLPPPEPPIRPACIEAVDSEGGGHMYSPNVIESLTRAGKPELGGRRAVDVYWNISTWHPYAVLLNKTRVEVD